MKKSLLFVILAISALLAACGAPAENKPANTNTNTAKPVAAAPTTDALMALEKQANEAYAKGDSKFFEGFLSDKAVMGYGKDVMSKAGVLKMISGAKCEGYEIKLSDGQVSKINDDTYAFTYKNESTGKCNEGPKSSMVDVKPVRAGTIWVRNGEKWQAAWHSETPIMAPPSSEKKEEAKPADAKKEEKPAADAKKEEKPAADAKKDEKAAEPKKDDKSAANANAAAPASEPAKPTASANTEALAKTHAAGWEAFRNKDSKWFEANIASTFAFVNPMGGYIGTKADTIKTWTETMKCEGITKTSFTDTFATSISPTVEILTGKGNADGKCDGQPNGDLWQTAVYVKEGDAWKLAYMFEQAPMKK